MPLVLKVNGRDLSPFLRVAHDDGLDPSPAESIEPQFAGSTALGEGQTYVGDSVTNPQMSFPLILKAATTDALYQLIRDIRGDLVKGASVEYRSGGASQSTFFDLENGKLDPDFEFWLDQAGRCRAQLTLNSRPNGHTGTTRALGSAVGTGAMTIPASGLSGDIAAQIRMTVNVASHRSASYAAAPVVLFGVKQNAPSGWDGAWRAASMVAPVVRGRAASNAVPVYRSLQGASGRLASQFLGFGMASSGYTGGDTIRSLGEFRPNPRTWAGRYRAFGVLNSLLLNEVRIGLAIDDMGLVSPAFSFESHFGATIDPSTDIGNNLRKVGEVSLASAQFGTPTSGWRLCDFGELSIPDAAAGASPQLLLYYKQTTSLLFNGPAATHPIRFDGLYLLPIDSSAGVMGAGKTGHGRDGSNVVRIDAASRSADLTFANASPRINTSANFRGDYPTIAPVGSAQLFVMAGAGPVGIDVGSERYDYVSNGLIEVGLAVRERFSYLR